MSSLRVLIAEWTDGALRIPEDKLPLINRTFDMGNGQTLRILGEIVLPLCRPLVAVILTVTFTYRWNEFAWPLTALTDPGRYTLPVGLDRRGVRSVVSSQAPSAATSLRTGR